jgi:predicted XRE-type DNA-binding protein
MTPSSGNVFVDLGLPDTEDRLAKAELARQIGAIIRNRRLTQSATADILGVDQPKVSALINGRLAGFSLERLMHFLTLLGQDVEIVVRSKPSLQPSGRLSVRLAPPLPDQGGTGIVGKRHVRQTGSLR